MFVRGDISCVVRFTNGSLTRSCLLPFVPDAPLTNPDEFAAVSARIKKLKVPRITACEFANHQPSSLSCPHIALYRHSGTPVNYGTTVGKEQQMRELVPHGMVAIEVGYNEFQLERAAVVAMTAAGVHKLGATALRHLIANDIIAGSKEYHAIAKQQDAKTVGLTKFESNVYEICELMRERKPWRNPHNGAHMDGLFLLALARVTGARVTLRNSETTRMALVYSAATHTREFMIGRFIAADRAYQYFAIVPSSELC